MLIHTLRLQRGWSQQQLAQLSGVSVRTIQRIERGKTASLESLKALAAVFEVDFNDLSTEPNMHTLTPSEREEARALDYVAGIKSFYVHLIAYLAVNTSLLLAALIVMPQALYWLMFAALGWGMGLLSHAIQVFDFFPNRLFGPDWEKRQVEKYLGRKL